MTVTIKFSTGKEIELTGDELRELYGKIPMTGEVYPCDPTQWRWHHNGYTPWEVHTHYDATYARFLNSTDIALMNTGSGTLTTYRFDGTDWAKKGE